MCYEGRSFHDVLLPSAQEYLPGGASYVKAMNAWSSAASHQSYSVLFLSVLMVMVALGMTGVVVMVRKHQARKENYMGLNNYGSR